METPGIVMLSPNFHPYVGGAEKQALELSKVLTGMGLRVSVLTRRKGTLSSRETVAGVPVRRLPAWGSGLADSLTFMASSFAWLVLHAAEYRVVHVHLAGSPAVSAALAGRLFGKRVVVKLGGGRGIGELAASERTFMGRLKLKVLAALAPRFVTVTRDLVLEMEEHGLRGVPIATVPNGVDMQHYRPAASQEKTVLKRKLGWPAAPCLLYVGRLSFEKRLGAFLEAFAAVLRETGSDSFFAIVGTGPEESSLKERVRKLGLGEKVSFHEPMSDVAEAYQAAEVFVLPSISEGLSNALLEAMACGCAVLGSRVGGTKEAVREGVSGLLFDPMDAADLKTQLTKLLLDPGRVKEMGGHARQEALERFDLRAVAKRYVEFYGLGPDPQLK